MNHSETAPSWWENCPSHAHSRTGIWDPDNGDKAGKICEQCRRWNEYPKLLERTETVSALIAADIKIALCVGPVFELESRLNNVFMKHYGVPFGGVSGTKRI